MENYPRQETFYNNITEEFLIAGRFLIYSGPAVLLILDVKEVYRASGIIDLVKMDQKVNRLEEVCDL